MSLRPHWFVPLEELDVQVTCAWLWERGDNWPGERGGGRDAEACEGRACVRARGAPAGRSVHADVRREATVSFPISSASLRPSAAALESLPAPLPLPLAACPMQPASCNFAAC